MVSWGIVTCCHAAVKNSQGLYAARFFLGLMEAGEYFVSGFPLEAFSSTAIQTFFSIIIFLTVPSINIC